MLWVAECEDASKRHLTVLRIQLHIRFMSILDARY